MEPNVKSVIAHITLVGWLVAFLINNENKDEFTTFYLRQSLGLNIAGMLIGFIPLLKFPLAVVLLVFWLFSIISAAQSQIKETPYVGPYFQDWFKGI